MFLGQLLKSVSKDYRKIHVRNISFDSRKVKKGDIFFAIKGKQTSGIKFINEAITRGASAIISSKEAKYKNYTINLEISYFLSNTQRLILINKGKEKND